MVFLFRFPGQSLLGGVVHFSLNVGRKTIYHHDPDKFDLLDKLIEEQISERNLFEVRGSSIYLAS